MSVAFSSRVDSRVLVLLAGVFGILVFPEPLAKVAPWAPPLCASAALLAAMRLLRSRPALLAIIGCFALALTAGWLRADATRTVLSHFTNASLGVLAFAVIVSWARTPDRLRTALALSVLTFGGAVVAGYLLVSATGTSGPKFLPWASPDRQAAVVLPGMTQASVNRNVVGILAVAAMPMMLAWASAAGGAGRWGRLRILIWLALPILLFIAIESQSISVYAAALAVLGAWFLGQRAGRWRLRLLIVLGAVALVLLVPALLVLHLPRPESSILPEMTPDGVTLSPVNERGPQGNPVALVREARAGTRHELRKVVRVPPGPFSATAIVKPMGSAGVLLYGAWYARLDLETGQVDDLGARGAWTEPLGDGWVALRSVFLSTSPGDVHVGLRLLDSFPSGEEYSGDPSRGILVSGVYLHPASGVVERIAMTRLLFKASAKSSLAARQRTWNEATSLARDNALWGIGLDMTRHRAEIVHAHNFILQTVLDLGLAGSLSVLALLVLFVRAMASCWTRGDDEAGRIGWNAGLAVLALQVFGLVDAIALGAKVGLVFWLSGGILVAAHYLAHSRSSGASTPRTASETGYHSGLRS